MEPIPPIDLTQQYRSLADDLLPVIEETLASGRYIGGPQVDQFEQSFAQFVGCSEAAISCNSGTDALYLGLKALDVGPGDEVITTPFSFFATAEAISLTGARPVFADICADTFNLNPAAIEACLSPRTRAILPVHLFGHPADMSAVMAIAEQRGLAVVEDCAQATGACWQGQPVGSIGHVGCFSFFPTKNLGGMGDGGAVTTSDPEVAARIRRLKAHGSDRRYFHDEIGVNSRLDTLQATILLAKLPHLREWNRRRNTIAQGYLSLLESVDDLALPSECAGGAAVWNQFTVRILGDGPEAANPGHLRNRIQTDLRERGVISMIYYPLPMHLQAAYTNLGHNTGDFPVAEACAHQVLSLPMFPELTAEQQQHVTDSLKSVLQQVAIAS